MSITTKTPFEFTFQSGHSDAMKRRSVTPRDSLVSSSAIWSPKSDAKQPVRGVNALSPEGGIRSHSSSSSLRSSITLPSKKPEKRATKTKAPYGFGVRSRSTGGGGGGGDGGVVNEDE
jgi:hypothetical protein